MRKILSIIIGIIFIFSGFIKGVDPFGTSLKIGEYLKLLGIDTGTNVHIILSILLCSLELLIGLFLLFGLYRRFSAIMTILVMIGFTTLTSYIAFVPYITFEECGCFGEFIKLTTIETVAKNVIILSISIWYGVLTFTQYKDVYKKDIILKIYLILVVLIPLCSYSFLPAFDFTSYNRGDNIFANKGFFIYDSDLNNVTNRILEDKVTIITIPYVLTDNEILKIKNKVAEFARNDIDVRLVTSVSQNNIIDTPYFYINDSILKSIIRSHQCGLVVIDHGIIKEKWLLNGYKESDSQILQIILFFTYILFGLLITVFHKSNTKF